MNKLDVVRGVPDSPVADHHLHPPVGTAVAEHEKAGLTIGVLANPIKRCGVHLCAKQQAQVLGCDFLTDPQDTNGYDLIYLHWHPNFDFQHPNWAQELQQVKVPVALIVHDYLFYCPVNDPLTIFAFDRRSVPLRAVTEIPMPLQQPYPFRPRTEPDPDRVGFFGFYGPGKGVWTVLAYARHHRKKARFITTLHPFAPPWTAAEFSEFVSAVKRAGMELITDWLEGQELADAMGECGFFAILHLTGGFGASASVTSVLAAHRPVFADKRIRFLRSAAPFVLPFQFEQWPTEKDLRQAVSLIEQSMTTLSPERIWREVHTKVLDELHSRGYNSVAVAG